jgi:hypothetical protein
MKEQVLLPEQTVEGNGEGPALELGDAVGQKFLLTLDVSRVVEQESLDVSLWGSEDGSTWNKLAAFPQKFYTGTHQLLVDLTPHPSVRFIRGKWEVNRWGKGELKPRFTFSVRLEALAGPATS